MWIPWIHSAYPETGMYRVSNLSRTKDNINNIGTRSKVWERQLAKVELIYLPLSYFYVNRALFYWYFYSIYFCFWTSLEHVPSDLFSDLPYECNSLNLSLTDLNTDKISGNYNYKAYIEYLWQQFGAGLTFFVLNNQIKFCEEFLISQKLIKC